MGVFQNYLHLELARLQLASLVVDHDFVVAAFVQDDDVVGVLVVHDAISLHAWHTGSVEAAFILPGA